MAKRYYWLKLQKDFARDKRIKKLKKIPGGYNFAFIYLEMILSTIDKGGVIEFEMVEESLAKEIGLELDEDPDAVQITISYLMSVGLMEDLGDGRYLLPYAAENLGSEGASAKRMRDYRERQKILKCNEKTIIKKEKASLCDTSVTQPLRNRYVETETDKETDIETDIETDRQEKHFESKCQSKSQADSLSENKSIPTLEEVAEYVKNNNIKIDPVKFYAKNNARGWMTKEGKPVKRWKTLLLSWAEHEKGYESDSSTFRQNDYDFERLEEELTRN